MIYIYTLADPDTLEVRYVGKTKRPKTRFSEHTYERLLKTKQTHSAYWLRKLLEEGKKPVMCVVAQTEGDWSSLEKVWIKKYSDLCNHTEGGEGCHGHIQSEAHKEKRRQSMLGKNKGKSISEEHKQAISRYSKTRKNKPLKYTLEQIKEVKKELLTDNCKASIARKHNVNSLLVYEIASGKKYKDVKI